MVAQGQRICPGLQAEAEGPVRRDRRDRSNVPGVGLFTGLKTSVFLEVEGAAHYLPAYAGNLDIMTSAALRTAETIAEHALTMEVA